MLLIISIVAGLIASSFLNAWLWRHRHRLSLWPRSECPQCHHQLGWLELIPVLSFLLQKGRCRHCHKKISWQYPLVEAALALLFFLAVKIFSPPPDWTGILNIVLVWYLLWVLVGVFVYDLEYGEIPDQLTIPALIIFLILPWRTEELWRTHLLSGIVGGGFFALQFFISRGRWIGGGDIRLGALMGLILGWQKLLLALLLAYVSGAIFGIYLILRREGSWQSRLPFGTFLSTATLIALFYGNEIIRRYLSLVHL